MSRPSGYGVPAPHQGAGALSPLTPLTCPSCGFQGEGVTYFSRSGPVMGALLLALLTMPFMGAGGLVYYLMRYDYRACPRCGESWGKRAERARALALSMQPNGTPALPSAAPVPEMREDSTGLRICAYVFFAFAAFLMMIGIGEGEIWPALFGAASAAGGALVWTRANTAREERRHALLIGLQQPVLRLAAQRDGVLTVTDVAAALAWPLPRAEKVLNSLEDGLRVSSSVTDEGVIVYEFRELMHAPRLSASEMDTMLNPPPPRERSGNGGTLMV